MRAKKKKESAFFAKSHYLTEKIKDHVTSRDSGSLLSQVAAEKKAEKDTKPEKESPLSPAALHDASPGSYRCRRCPYPYTGLPAPIYRYER